MTSPQGTPAQADAAGAVGTASYWVVPVLRSVPAIIVGLIITFVADHSAKVGLVSFGTFALVSGAIVAIASARTLTDRVTRVVFIAQGAIAAASGIAALTLWTAGVGVLLFIVTVFAALTGALELYAGMRAKGTAPARDWFAVGALTAVSAIFFVLIPPDSVLATGLIGAYGLVLGVFLVIAGLSLKWATGKSAQEVVTK